MPRWHAACAARVVDRSARLAGLAGIAAALVTIGVGVGLWIVQRDPLKGALPVVQAGSAVMWAAMARVWWLRAEGRSPDPQPDRGAARLMAVLSGCAAAALLGLVLWWLAGPAVAAVGTMGGLAAMVVLLWRRARRVGRERSEVTAGRHQ